MPRLLYLLPLLLLAACAPSQDQGPDERYANQIVTRKDRNNDGTYDYELHRFPAGAEPNYELLDTDHDGIYDQKIIYGYTIRRETVDVPVPGAGRATSSGRSAALTPPAPTPRPTPRVRTYNN